MKEAPDKIGKDGRRRRYWLCRCECGNSKVVYEDNLKYKKTVSCGCLQKEMASKANTKHGETDSRLYGVWCAMKRRCYNEEVPEYRLYGGRGIRMCKSWKESYEAFRDWAMNAGYNPDANRGTCTIDRIDNNKGYSPENCRWVDQKTQMNNVSYNIHITHDGITHTISEWADIYNMTRDKLYQRLFVYGYDFESAVNKR